MCCKCQFIFTVLWIFFKKEGIYEWKENAKKKNVFFNYYVANIYY